MINVSRRFILKGGLILGGATLLGLRFTSRALAKGKELKNWMGDRMLTEPAPEAPPRSQALLPEGSGRAAVSRCRRCGRNPF